MGREVLQDKVKVLIATDCFLPRWDGIARFLAEIIPRLKDKYDISVIAPAHKGHEKVHPGVKMHWIKTHKFKVADFPPAKLEPGRIKKAVKAADVVFVQTIGPIGALAIRYAKKMKKAVIAYNHSIEWELASEGFSQIDPVKFVVEVLAKAFTKHCYKKCDLLLVPSKQIVKVLDDAKIKTPKKIVQMGINSDKFKPPKSKDEAKEKIGIDHSNVVIGFCGRLGREKDLVTLYRAFIQLKYRYKNVKLLVVGDGIDKYKDMFGKKKDIIMTGSVDNVVPYLQAMDVFVLPSITETSSLATMEAMSCGLPVIVTKVGSIPDYVVNKHNGLFFPTRNSYMLRKKLELLLDNVELRGKIGENARDTIEVHYSWDETVKEIDEVLNVF